MEEIWRDIPGYEGRYQASTEGRIRSVDRWIAVRASQGRRAYTQYKKGRMLRPGRMPSGHYSVVLGHGQHGSTVHSLVMLTFVGPCPEGKEICHNDGNPANNRLNNLRYDTRSENIIDDLKRGVRKRTKLREQDVHDIRQRLLNGEQGHSIARAYGVNDGVISGIKRRRTFAWLD